MKTINKFTIPLLIMVIVSSCATPTYITRSWRKPNATTNGYRNIFVAALTKNVPAKQKVEDGLQTMLQQKGLTVEKSIDVFPPTFSALTGQTEELVLSKIQSTGADGILTVALLRKETENRYDPAWGYWQPGVRFGYYNRFWDYYHNWYPYLYTPGYYQQDKVYYLETNFYDAKTEQLIWAAQSKTYNPSGIDNFLKGYLKAIYKQMAKDGLILGNGGDNMTSR